MAATFWASFSRRAMVCLRRVIRTRSSRASSAGAAGARAIIGAATGAAGGRPAGSGATSPGAFSRAARTSPLSTWPRLPVPVTCSAARPFSAISFAAAGDGGMAVSATASRTCTSSGPAVIGSAVPPFGRMRPSTSPTVTVSPVFLTICASVPAASAASSCDALSVSSSTSGSSSATASPSALNHSPTSASVTDSPALGTTMSMSSAPPAGACSASAAAAFALSPPPSALLALATGGAALPAAASPIEPSRAPTPTVSPSLTAIEASVPAAGAGTSMVTLSVSSSTSGSSAATASPAFLNHCPTVASLTDSPSVGTLMSVAMIAFPRARPGGAGPSAVNSLFIRRAPRPGASRAGAGASTSGPSPSPQPPVARHSAAAGMAT